MPTMNDITFLRDLKDTVLALTKADKIEFIVGKLKNIRYRLKYEYHDQDVEEFLKSHIAITIGRLEYKPERK